MAVMSSNLLPKFQSTPLSRGETKGYSMCFCSIEHFNPLPSHEGRRNAASSLRMGTAFQSTPLSRGETLMAFRKFSFWSYFNPLPSHEGRRPPIRGLRSKCYFNPLPSHEGRLGRNVEVYRHNKFQSTPLSRGETGIRQDGPGGRGHFNPLPSHEGRRCKTPGRAAWQ